MDYLIHGENHDELNRAMLARGLGELDEAQLKAGIDSMMGVMTEELQAKKKTQKTKTTMAADEKDAVSRLLQFGGMLPASQQESELTTMLEELNQELAEKQTTGAPIEELSSLMNEINDTTQQLERAQQGAQKKGKSTMWKLDADRTEQLFGGHRQTIAEVARDVLLPKYLVSMTPTLSIRIIRKNSLITTHNCSVTLNATLCRASTAHMAYLQSITVCRLPYETPTLRRKTRSTPPLLTTCPKTVKWWMGT